MGTRPVLAPGILLRPGAPWSVRLARGPGSRPALEIYESETIVDIVVVTWLPGPVLRGARRAVSGGRASALAWGRLPADGTGIALRFSRGSLRSTRGPAVSAEVIEIAGSFWLATADGRFDAVTVTQRDGIRRHRIRAGRRR